jgi:hypothetical protein
MNQITVKSGAAANVKELLMSAVENELKIIRAGIGRTEKELSLFEKMFGMETAAFYEQYRNGYAGDAPEHIRWAGEYETLERLRQDYEELREVEFC